MYKRIFGRDADVRVAFKVHYV